MFWPVFAAATSESWGTLEVIRSKLRIKKIRKLKSIHWKYFFFHWISTLLIAPFVVQLLMHLTRNNAHQIVGLIEVSPITLIFSLIFSFPTYLLLAITDYFCLKKEFAEKRIKKNFDCFRSYRDCDNFFKHI